MKQCLFNEPWRGQCKEEVKEDEMCCEKHSKEKCQVCGEQAFTRCQASIGVMCGIPLCDQCGHGEMCLYHAGGGPIAIIRGLLDGGPVPSVFATVESLEEERLKMIEKVANLLTFKFAGTLSKPIAEQIIEQQLKRKERESRVESL